MLSMSTSDVISVIQEILQSWWWLILAALGLPSAITGLIIRRMEKRMDSREAERKRFQEAAERRADEREDKREQFENALFKSTMAAIALGEATARAVQRIPDAHCNGDMHAALEYAAKIKHEEKDLLMGLGIHAMYED